MKRVLITIIAIILSGCQQNIFKPTPVVHDVGINVPDHDWEYYSGYGYELWLPGHFEGEVLTDRLYNIYGSDYAELWDGYKSPLIDPYSDQWVEFLFAFDDETDFRTNDTLIFIEPIDYRPPHYRYSPEYLIQNQLNNLPQNFDVLDADYELDIPYTYACALMQMDTSLKKKTTILCWVENEGFGLNIQLDTSTKYFDETLPIFEKILRTISINKPSYPWLNPSLKALLSFTVFGVIFFVSVIYIVIRRRVTRVPMTPLKDYGRKKTENS